MSTHDPTDLFRGAAHAYARYRPAYPPALIAETVRRFGLDGPDGNARVLDLGCGTGQLALLLAPHAAHVVGVDPEPGMLAEAGLAAAARGITNATWLRGSDRDLTRLAPQIGPARLAVMGRSFHWMQRDATLADLDGIVEPGGGVLICGDGDPFWGGSEPWQLAARATIQRWLGPKRRAGSGTVSPEQEHERFEVILGRSVFSRVEIWETTYPLARPLDAVVGHLYSTSYASPALFGDKRAGFEADLRATLAPFAESDTATPDGLFRETITVDAVFAWRP